MLEAVAKSCGKFRGCVNYNDFHLGLWSGLAIG